MSLLKKLSIIQTSLIAPKSQVNNFGKYKYRSCEDILAAVKPLLREHEVILTLSDEIDCIGERIYIRAVATLSDDEGNMYVVSGLAREPESKKGMDESQITGAASSYARKYALNGLFCIDDTKDADATNDHGELENRVKKHIENSKSMIDLEKVKDHLSKETQVLYNLKANKLGL